MVDHICKSKAGWTINKCSWEPRSVLDHGFKLSAYMAFQCGTVICLASFFFYCRLATTLPGNQLSLRPSTFQLWHKSTCLMMSLRYQSSSEFQSYPQWQPTYFSWHLLSYPSKLGISPLVLPNFTWEITGDSSLCCPFFMRDGLGLATFREDPGVFDFEYAGLWETLKIGMKWFGLYQVPGVYLDFHLVSTWCIQCFVPPHSKCVGKSFCEQCLFIITIGYTSI